MNEPDVVQTIDGRAVAGRRRETSQLRRLETLTDVVYGIAIWRVFILFPRPDEPTWNWHSWREFLAAEGMTAVLIAIGVAVLIIYWLQSNTLFSLVERADGKFAVRAIMQLFFVLLFLFAIRVGTELPASAWTRGFESVAALLLGLSSTWMWSYAAKGRRLLHDDVTDDEAKAVHRRITAEPATAAFTLPFIFTPMFWELAWFTYPFVRKFFRRIARG
ncbi:TMEM175 family protein [Gemmatimonadota bacterium]